MTLNYQSTPPWRAVPQVIRNVCASPAGAGRKGEAAISGRGETKRLIAPIAGIYAWHDALNSGNTDRLVELVHEEVEVGGPRAAGRGVVLLREWVERAEIRLEPRRVFHQDGAVVVEQRAAWRSADTGRYGDPHGIASSFWIRDGRVQRVTRYADLDEALAAAGLDTSHEVRGAATGP